MSDKNFNSNPDFKGNKDDNKVEQLCNYAKSNKEEIGVYTALALAILFLFFAPLLGELILGVIGGFYFAKELAQFFQNSRFLYDDHGRLRYTVIIGLLVGLFLMVPVFILAILLTASIKQFFFSSQKM